MKKKIAAIIKHNWGLMKPGSWRGTKWIIYDDYSLEKEECYNLSREERTNIGTDIDGILEGRTNRERIVLNEDEFKSLISLFNNCVHKNFASVHAWDGVAWEFEYYKDGKLLWNRQTGYIHTIEALEEIASFISQY